MGHGSIPSLTSQADLHRIKVAYYSFIRVQKVYTRNGEI